MTTSPGFPIPESSGSPGLDNSIDHCREAWPGCPRDRHQVYPQGTALRGGEEQQRVPSRRVDCETTEPEALPNESVNIRRRSTSRFFLLTSTNYTIAGYVTQTRVMSRAGRRRRRIRHRVGQTIKVLEVRELALGMDSTGRVPRTASDGEIQLLICKLVLTTNLFLPIFG